MFQSEFLSNNICFEISNQRKRQLSKQMDLNCQYLRLNSIFQVSKFTTERVQTTLLLGVMMVQDEEAKDKIQLPWNFQIENLKEESYDANPT